MVEEKEKKNLFFNLIQNIYIPDNFSFNCQNCGSCCRGEEGLVLLFEPDIKKILKNLKIPFETFKNIYTKNYYTFLSLKEKENKDCIFWEENENFKGCKIYKFKPYQCDSFPFWISVFLSKNSFDHHKKKCPGFFKGKKNINKKEIIKRIYIDFNKRFQWFKYLYDFSF